MSSTPPPSPTYNLTDAHEANDSPIKGLYPPADAAAKKQLLEFIGKAGLGFGTWRFLKGLYKRVEADALAGRSFDSDVLGALIARLDRTALHLDAGTAGQVDLGKSAGTVRAAALGAGGRLVVQGSHYSSGYIERITVYDLTKSPDPMKPRVLGHTDGETAYPWSNHGNGQPVQSTAGGYVYTMLGDWGTHRLTCWDLSGERGPIKRGAYSTDQEVISHAVASAAPVGVVLLGAEGRRNSSRLVRLDLSNPDRIVARDPFDLKANAQNIALSEDGRSVVVSVPSSGFTWSSLPRPGGLRFLDISDPSRPPRAAAAIDRNGINCLAIQGGFVYAGVHAPSQNREPSGIYVYDLVDPRRSGFLPFTGEDTSRFPNWVTVDGRRRVLYVSCQDRTLLLVDIADPLRPRLLCRISNAAANSIALRGDTAYAFSGNYYGGNLVALDVKEPARAYRIGVPPSEETIAYMKRRARRLLKRLADDRNNPTRYAEAAAAFLRAASDSKQAAVNRATQWVSMDVLFGGGGRWQQHSHGRGAYALRDKTERWVTLRRREERSPGAWNARPDLLTGLLATPDLPTDTYEMAARALHVNRIAIPATLPDRSLRRFLTSNAPLLVRIAVGQVAMRMMAQKSVDAALAADAVVRAGAARRRVMDAALPSYTVKGDEWATKFTARVLAVVAESVTAAGEGTPLGRRAAGALALLANRFPESAGDTSGWAPLLSPALAARHPALTPFLLDLMAKNAAALVDPGRLGRAVAARMPDLDALLSGLPADLLDRALDALARGMAGQEIPQRIALNGVEDSSEAVRAAMWKLLAASATPATTLAVIWNYLFDSAVTATPALQTAMASPEALATLARSGVTPEQIAARLAEKPFLVGLLSPETFSSVSREAPAEVTLSLIAAAPDELWGRLRSGLVRNLREGFGLTAFWKALPGALDTDSEDRLATRLLGDADIADTFLGIEDAEAALSLRDVLFAPLLARYVERRLLEWPRDSEILLTAAAHALPEVREPAVARILSLGMGLGFALRLLESEVPDAVAAGRSFFEATAAGEGSTAFTNALALCDSPVLSVRTYGRRYVLARWDILPRADLYRALFENPAPEMQAFVAALLDEEPIAAAETVQEDTARFDGEVLRTRNRARRAKEAVKARQERAPAPTVDIPTLLALARGADGTPRDAEWALAQLTRLALSGVEIEGFAVVEG